MNDFYQSEKNFLERLADAIPGIAGYRQKEAARDTDKRLREYMASEMDLLRRRLDDFRGVLMRQSRLDLLDDLDLLSRKMTRLADSIRYATYGYSGFFDQVKFREEELARLYDFDLQLLDRIAELRGLIDTLNAKEDPGPQLSRIDASLNQFDQTFQQRHQLFNRPIQET